MEIMKSIFYAIVAAYAIGISLYVAWKYNRKQVKKKGEW
jgi:hypothetical protein